MKTLPKDLEKRSQSLGRELKTWNLWFCFGRGIYLQAIWKVNENYDFCALRFGISQRESRRVFLLARFLPILPHVFRNARMESAPA
jgi:hypothetical protein